MAKTYDTFSTKRTPQSKPVPGKDQVENAAGGYVWQIDDWKFLDRFLVLGTEGGTYYVKEQEFTQQGATRVLACIQKDGVRAVDRILEISQGGRAPKNTPALFALALATWAGDQKTRTRAYEVLPNVARTGYHLLIWARYCDNLRGTGSGFQRAIGRWFNDKGPSHLALQAVKYQQREGWTLRDLLRLAHQKPVDEEHDMIYRWITHGWDWGDLPDQYSNDVPVPPLIWAHEKAKYAENSKDIIGLIDNYRIPRESIPTKYLNEPSVWEALLNTKSLPPWATLRNLGKMTKVGLLVPMSDAMNKVVSMFSSEEAIRKSRLHPLAILVAMKIYAQGHGMRGKLTWTPQRQIIDVLDEAFYTAFGNVEPAGQNFMLSQDVSSSMAYASIAGMPISPAEASAAMLLITANVEQNYIVNAFQRELTEITISPKQRLDDVTARIKAMSFGSTDCALPMIDAKKKGYKIDTFIIYTDNETWYGKIHPFQALQEYRDAYNSAAKLITVGMTGSRHTIADPSDAGMLDVVGFDTATPNLISEFSQNKVQE
jgi:60 kDa SS-A/Ro ribonucleoprotein